MCYYTVIKLSVTCTTGVLFPWDTGVVAQIIFYLVMMMDLHTSVELEG